MQPVSESGRPLPRCTPIAATYFAAAREHRFVMQRCPRDGFFYYPRTRCPGCLGDDWEWEALSGRGVVHAFTIDRVGHDPAQRGRLPLIIAIVELVEGPRLTSNIVDCVPETMSVGLEVEVVFEDIDAVSLIQFRLR